VPLTLPPSGYLDANGPFFAKRAGDDIIIGLRIEPRHCNAIGIAHGGMILTLADVLLTVGSNIRARTSRFLPTVNVTCDFIGPAKQGDWIEGRIEVLKVTKSYVFSQALLQTDVARPVARISGVLIVRGDPDPAFAPERYFGG
jgi:uncharacterized protein (TIGR00369 family)